jgi:hypothetical protein
MYLCGGGIDVASCYALSIAFWNFSDVWYASLFCHRTTCENVVYNIFFSFFVNYFVFQSVEERQMRISKIKD